MMGPRVATETSQFLAKGTTVVFLCCGNSLRECQPILQKKGEVIRNQRVNDQIRNSPVRVVNRDGEMIGEMPTDKAQKMAADAGLDLVEVAPDARPPVCRIMDYGKIQYTQRKKRNEGGKAHRTQLKQIRLRAKTGEHDIEFKVRRAEEFLRRKDKVKINVLFRGRENAHHERGREMLLGIIQTLENVSTVEKPPSMESGRMMTTVLVPKG